MNSISKHSYQEGNVRRLLFMRTLPMIMGIFSMMAFNLVDMFFISRLGIEPLAAISFTFPVVIVISSFTLGLGAGASAVISRAIGESEFDKVRHYATDSIILAFLFTCFFVAAGFAGFDTIFNFLGAHGRILEMVRSYMYIWYWGMICVVVPMVGNNIIRATGDTRMPGLLMCLAIVINIILDPLLIFGYGPFPAMGIAGAAVATVISRAVTFVIVLIVLIRKYDIILLRIPEFSELMDSWKKILYIGLPNAVTNVSVPAGIGIFTKMMSWYGPEAVAAFGVTSRIKSFTFIIIFSLSTVLGPFIGQNYGAGKICRAYQGVRESNRFALLWGVLCALLLFVFAEPLVRIFTDDQKVLCIAADYLRILPVGYGFNALLILSSTVFTVLNRPFKAMFLNVLYMFILSIPLAYLFSRFYGLTGIFIGAVLAQIFSGVYAACCIKKYFRPQEETCLVDGVYAEDQAV